MNNLILFYGNCQTGALHKIIDFDDSYEKIDIFCLYNYKSKEEFRKLIKKCCIIITQPINDNYRDVDYLGTKFILDNALPTCQIIIFPSCFFDFYYPDLIYTKLNNSLLNIPNPYHYENMINYYKEGIPLEEYLKNCVDNYDFYSSSYLIKKSIESLKELEKREKKLKKNYYKENVFYVFITDFIKKNFTKKLLFYSMNHPTKYLFHYICEEIKKFIKIEIIIDYEKDPLDYTRCMIYKSLQKILKFNIENYKPKLNKKNDNKSITEIYYRDYKKMNFH